MILALLAGFAAWFVGERTMDISKPSKAAAANYRDPGPLNKEMPMVNSVNGALTFGALGTLLGLAMGVGGGLCRRSVQSAALGAVVGLILGAAAGALPSFLVMPWQWRHRNDDPASIDLMVPMMVHFALWGAVGLAAGIAFAVGSSGPKPVRIFEAALAGLIGAMIGTFIYEVVGATLFPFEHTTSPFSDTIGTRLFARLCLALFVALGVIRAIPPAHNQEA
jgi:hypothetical protein